MFVLAMLTTARRLTSTAATRVVGWLLLLVLSATAGCAAHQAQQWKEKIEAAGKALEQNRLAAAEELYTAALREAEALGRETPLEGVSLAGLARVWRFQGRYEAAEMLLHHALPILEKAYGQDVPVALAAAESGVVQDFLGRPFTAEGLYMRSLTIFRQKGVPLTNAQVAHVLDDLKDLYRDLGRYAEAARVLELWLPMWSDEKVVERIPRVVADGLVQLGDLYELQGRYADAAALLARAVALREKALGEGHPVTITTMTYLARLYRAQGKPEDAERTARQALAAAEKAQGADHPSVAESLGLLAVLHQDQGRHQETERLQRRAIEIREKVFGQDDPTVAEGLEDLARLLRKAGRAAEAETAEFRARAIRARHTESAASRGPAEAQDGSCRVRLIPTNPSRMEFLIQGLGFEGNEELEMIGRSNGEVLRQKLRVEGDGSFAGRYAASVLGKHTGVLSETFIGKSCRLTLRVEWGRRIGGGR